MTTHPHAAALALGAKALRDMAHKLAPEANMYASGIHRPYLKRSYTEYTRLRRYAEELETLAGRRKVETE